jgi:CHAT domain-containing protein
MVTKSSIRVFLILINISFCILAFSQKKKDLELSIKSIDTAFQVNNWEKVTRLGQIFDSQLKETKLKTADSLLIIASLNTRYKIAVAYTWQHKTDAAKLETEKFSIKKERFPKHKTCADFFKISATGQIAFINNQDKDAVKLIFDAYHIANKKLKTNTDIYTLAIENLAIYYISEYQLLELTKLLYSTLLYFSQNKVQPVYIARVYYLFYLTNYFDANYQSALENAKQCFSLLQKSEKAKESFLVAKAKSAIGICLFHLKEYNKSKETLHQAWQLFNKFGFLNNQEFALNLNYLGRVYYFLKNYTLAMEYKLKTSKIFEEIYQSPAHFRVLQVTTSRLYALKNRINTQIQGIDLETYEQLTSFEYVFRHLPVNYQTMSSAHQLYFYGQQALTYVRLNQFLEAITYLKKGLSLKMKSFPEHHSLLRPWYKLIGNCYTISGNQDSAIFYYQKALESYKINENQPHQTGKINNSYQKSPELIELFFFIGKSDFLKARKENNTKKHLSQALVYFKNCDKLAAEILTTLKSKEDRLLLAEYMDQVYDLGIVACFELSALKTDEFEKEILKKQAFIFSQRSKANQLEEMVTKFDIRKKMRLPKQVVNQELELKNKINFWRQAVSGRTIIDENELEHPIIYYRKRINNKSFNKSETIDSLNYYLNLNDKLVKKLEQKFPEYFRLLYSQKIYSINKIQDYLDSSSVVLDYHLNNEQVEIFAISKDNFSAFSIKTPKNFSGIIDDYIYSISGFYRKSDFEKKAMETFIKNGASLYKYLLKPIEKDIKTKKKLIIIVSKELALMPFETLVATDNIENRANLSQLDYLIKKYAIAYNYSCNLMIESIKKSNQNRSLPNNFLGIAPVFDPDKMQVKGELNETSENKMRPIKRVRLGKLAATKKAVDNISFIASNKGVPFSKFYYQDASKSTFLNEVGNKKYILLATHGKADYENPKLSGLYFAPTGANENFDGDILYAPETYNLNLSNDLLVLFACETGTGQLKKGEGVMTLSRGFMASGSANIIHTLWSIQDVSTKDIVISFFEGVFNNTDYSNSMRNSKLKLIEYGVIPFHWAGLVLIGH